MACHHGNPKITHNASLLPLPPSLLHPLHCHRGYLCVPSPPRASPPSFSYACHCDGSFCMCIASIRGWADVCEWECCSWSMCVISVLFRRRMAWQNGGNAFPRSICNYLHDLHKMWPLSFSLPPSSLSRLPCHVTFPACISACPVLQLGLVHSNSGSA